MTPGDVPLFPRSSSLVRGREAEGGRLAIPRPHALRAARQEPGTRNREPRRAGDGFTLIELMIVVTVIGILATIAQPMVRNAVVQAREAALRENLYVLRDAIDKFYADNERYPASLADLVERRYVRRLPKDPFTGSAETWQAVYFTDEKGQEAGVIDVRSGSEAVGSDGQRYADW